MDELVAKFDDGAKTKLTEMVVQAAGQSGGCAPTSKSEHSDEIKALFAARRDENDPQPRKEISKRLWRALRTQRRQRKEQCLDDLARRGAGSREMKKAMMRCAGIDRASAVCDAAGVVQTEPDSMCEVFAKFYEDL